MPNFLPTSTGYGTQNAPMDSFAVDGRTGNKTTNKDLPQWLRDLGMKGDAYAGGMLKPELRYGFKYKNGKIHFADGQVYDAKKQKDGSYSYTGTDGVAQSYSPTDEQNAYNKKYKAATDSNGFFEKVGNTLEFEFDHLKNLVGDFGINNAFFGVDPLGVKVGNALTGRDDKALVTQLGGATPQRFADYEAKHGEGSLGFAPELHKAAGTIASIYGGQALGALAGKGMTALGTSLGEGTLGSAATKAGSLIASNPKMAGKLVTALGSKFASTPDAITTPGAGALSTTAGAGVGTDVLNPSAIGRERTPMPTNLKRYGMGPEHAFYQPPGGGALSTVQPIGVAPPQRVFARGGLSSVAKDVKYFPLRSKQRADPGMDAFYRMEGNPSRHPRARIALGDNQDAPTRLVHRAEGGALTQSSPYVAHGTGESGRADNIDAKLSENEYVIDAETVALLGDGNPEAGAKKLDAMRSNIRKHKGGALAKGEISPDAMGGALQYLARGGKVKSLQKAMGEYQAVLSQGVSRSTGFDARDRIAAKHGVSTARLDQALMDLHSDAYPASDDEVAEAIRGKIDTPTPLRKVIKKAGGGSVRPRQSITAALDAQDEHFDDWRRLPRKDRKAATPGYAARQRARVGDKTYDLDPPKRQRMAKLAEGGKVGALRSIVDNTVRRALDEKTLAKARDHIDSEYDLGNLTPKEYGKALDRLERAAKKGPRKYAEGGKVGVLKSLMQKFRGPKADPNAHLIKMRGVLDTALAYRAPPKQRVGGATAEELEQDVQQLRREQSRRIK